MKIRTARRPFAVLALCAALALSLAACQENPEGTIVAHKDMDKLISQAAASDPGKTGAEEVVADAKKTEAYQTTLDNENLGVTAKVDASVEVPDVEKLSIYRVEQKAFDQEFIDKVRNELMGGRTLYEGRALDVRTKAQIEGEIQSLRQEAAEADAQMRQATDESGQPAFSEEEIQSNAATYQESIDSLQKEYESAAASLDLASYPFDGKLTPVAELASRYPGDSHYEWLSSLNESGDEYFGITDGADGAYQQLYAQNDADHSNKLVFRSSPKGYEHLGGVMADPTNLDTEYNARDMSVGKDSEVFFQEKGLSGNILTNGFVLEPDMTFEPVFGDSVSLSQEEAEAQAQALLEKLGLTGFSLEQGGLYTEFIGLKGGWDSASLPYGVYYILQYCRDIDGVRLTQSSGGKFAEGYGNDGQYNKQMWPGEYIEFRINDSGIVGFDYLAPLQVTETVVDSATLMPFDQIKDTFEQMLPVTLASTDFQKVAQIDRVRLSYSRISEKDSFDTGLVVPVWSFEGKCEAYADGYFSHQESGTLLAVNAIDGSVIDADLGY